MKKLFVIAIIGVAAWYGIQRFLKQAKDTAASKHDAVNKSEMFLKNEDKQAK